MAARTGVLAPKVLLACGAAGLLGTQVFCNELASDPDSWNNMCSRAEYLPGVDPTQETTYRTTAVTRFGRATDVQETTGNPSNVVLDLTPTNGLRFKAVTMSPESPDSSTGAVLTVEPHEGCVGEPISYFVRGRSDCGSDSSYVTGVSSCDLPCQIGVPPNDIGAPTTVQIFSRPNFSGEQTHRVVPGDPEPLNSCDEEYFEIPTQGYIAEQCSFGLVTSIGRGRLPEGRWRIVSIEAGGTRYPAGGGSIDHFHVDNAIAIRTSQGVFGLLHRYDGHGTYPGSQYFGEVLAGNQEVEIDLYEAVTGTPCAAGAGRVIFQRVRD